MRNRFVQTALSAIALVASAAFAQAGSAQWGLAPASGDWNTAANWTLATVPNGPSDIATFTATNNSGITISVKTEVSAITFDQNANGYTIATAPTVGLTISGIGIVNNSGQTQNFVAPAYDSSNFATIWFKNSASAGTNTIFTTNGGMATGGDGGLITFADNSSVNAATFVNNADGPGFAGFTQFSNSASATNTTFVNNGATSGGTGSGGAANFGDTSTASNATFTTNGGSAEYAVGGQTYFYGQAAANQSTFITNAGSAANASGGATTFGQYSTANFVVFTTNGAALPYNVQGGRVSFTDNAKATGATFTINGGAGVQAVPGLASFDLNASVTNSTFTLNGSATGGGSAVVYFGGTSTVSGCAFTVSAGAEETSSGGLLKFFTKTPLSNVTVTNDGGSLSCATGGVTEFHDYANAGNSTLIANGGLDSGGQIVFQDFSDGGTARVDLFDNAILNLNYHSNSSPVNIGSLEGNGVVWLGYSGLVVGGNNVSTTFSGSLQDGGNVGVNSSLTKKGIGTLTLSGENTYTGATTLSSGALAMNGSSTSTAVVISSGIFAVNGSMPNVSTATVSGGRLIINGAMSGAVTANAGTLGGLGQIGSAILNKTSTLSPGNGSSGTLNVIGDLTFNMGSTYLVQLNGSGAGSQYDQTVVNGNINLGKATLSLKLGFAPAKGSTFTIINNAGSAAIASTFRNLKQKAKITVGKRVFQISYIGGDGNDVVLTTVR